MGRKVAGESNEGVNACAFIGQKVEYQSQIELPCSSEKSVHTGPIDLDIVGLLLSFAPTTSTIFHTFNFSLAFRIPFYLCYFVSHLEYHVRRSIILEIGKICGDEADKEILGQHWAGTMTGLSGATG